MAATALELALTALELALEALKRDTTRPVRARVDNLTVEFRAVAARAEQAPRAVVGLFADEPELLDEVCEEAMKARER
jgi:hypothetical protein